MAVVANAETSKPTGSATSAGQDPRRRNKGLLAVALFKFMKAIFFGTIGVGALHLLHHDVGDLVMRVTAVLPVDPEGRFVGFLMNQADLIGNHQLRQVGLYSMLYGGVCIVEGVGLYMEKTWAEYFTVILTVAALPYESWELWREPSLLRVSLLALNVIVLIYLLWLIRRMRHKKLPGS